MPTFPSPPKLARGLMTAYALGTDCPGPALRAGRTLVGKDEGQTGIRPHFHHFLVMGSAASSPHQSFSSSPAKRDT